MECPFSSASLRKIDITRFISNRVYVARRGFCWYLANPAAVDARATRAPSGRNTCLLRLCKVRRCGSANVLGLVALSIAPDGPRYGSVAVGDAGCDFCPHALRVLLWSVVQAEVSTSLSR